MHFLTRIQRGIALGLLALTVAAGCGGSGGASSPTQALDKAFGDGNFTGSFDEPTRSRGNGQTACTIRFGANGNGVASFVAGTPGDSTFRTYSADIQSVVYTPRFPATNPVSGTLTFDMTNFSAGAPFANPLHYVGSYSYTANPKTLTVSGTLTGKNKSGTDINVNFGINYNTTLPAIDLSGSYTGTIGIAGQSIPWTGTLANSTPLHLLATVNTAGGVISFDGQNARTSFAGAFDGGEINPIATGKIGQWYVETHDNGKTLVGAYVVIDSETGQPFDFNGITIAGTISATKGAGGTGGTSKLKTGYYDGGVMRNGQLDGRIFKMDIAKNLPTTGANGAMVIVTGTVAPNIGGRVASVVGNGNDVTVTIDQVTNTYSKIVLTGTVSDTAITNAAYTATLLDGSTETGTIDQLGQGTTVTSNFAGTWSGTVTGTSGTPNTFSATFTQANDVLAISSITSNLPVTLPSINGFVAGNSFAGFDFVADLPSPFTGNSFRGDFDGDKNNNVIAGSFVYLVKNTTSGSTVLTDHGTLSLTKQ